jgi:hypothetical protein
MRYREKLTAQKLKGCGTAKLRHRKQKLKKLRYRESCVTAKKLEGKGCGTAKVVGSCGTAKVVGSLRHRKAESKLGICGTAKVASPQSTKLRS